MDKGMLKDATSPDDAPTPGYILNEISRSTIASYPACTQLIDFLLSRITKNNHNVKYKCLNIIKHVCRTGRVEFKKDMARHVDVIKECLQYRGPLDPLRGDEIYRKVRDSAKETLDAIFDSQMPVATSAVAASNRISGFGGGDDMMSRQPQGSGSSSSMFSSMSSAISGALKGDGNAYSGHHGADGPFGPGSSSANGSGGMGNYGYNESNYTSPGYGGSGSGMQGIGNPNFQDARTEKTWLQKAAEASSKTVSRLSDSIQNMNFSENKQKLTDESFPYTNRGVNAVQANTGAYNPNMGFGSSSSSAYGNGNNTFQAYTNNLGMNSSTAGQSGSFGMNGNGPNSGAYSPNVQTNLDSNPAPMSGGMVPEIPTHKSGVGRVGSAAADGSYEKNLIASLVDPAGLKVAPPDDKLKQFLATAPTLSPDLVGPCLLEALNEDAWQSRVKALMVLAAMGKNQACSSHSKWWVEHAEDLGALATDTKASVRTQATKTAKALKIDLSSINSSPSGTSSAGNRESRNNGSDTTSASIPASGSAVQDDLLSLGSTQSGPQLDNVSLGALSPSQPANGSVDLFSGMTVASTSPATTTSAPSTIAPVTTFDFLDASVGSTVNAVPSVPQVPPPVPATCPSPTPTPFSNDMMDAPPPVPPPPAPGIGAPAPSSSSNISSAFDMLDSSIGVPSVPSVSSHDANTSSFDFMNPNGSTNGNGTANGTANGATVAPIPSSSSKTVVDLSEFEPPKTSNVTGATGGAANGSSSLLTPHMATPGADTISIQQQQLLLQQQYLMQQQQQGMVPGMVPGMPGVPLAQMQMNIPMNMNMQMQPQGLNLTAPVSVPVQGMVYPGHGMPASAPRMGMGMGMGVGMGHAMPFVQTQQGGASMLGAGKDIPTSEQASASAFAFMGGGGAGGAVGGGLADDSFSFIQNEVKASQGKKS